MEIITRKVNEKQANAIYMSRIVLTRRKREAVFFGRSLRGYVHCIVETN